MPFITQPRETPPLHPTAAVPYHQEMVVLTRLRRTLADYERLPERPRVELIDGEFFPMNAPLPWHQIVAGRIYRLLDQQLESNPVGVAIMAPVDCVLSEVDVVQPDVIVLTRAHAGRIRNRIEGAPDLVVEVLSPSNPERDRIVKRDLYLRSGVAEFWLADPEAATVEVRVAEAGAWVFRGIFAAEDVLTTPLLPGIEVPVARIFGPIVPDRP